MAQGWITGDLLKERIAKPKGHRCKLKARKGALTPDTLHTQTSDRLSAASREFSKEAARMPSRESDTSRMLLLEEDTATAQPLPGPGVKCGASTVSATASELGRAGRRQRRFSKTDRLINTAE